MLAQTKIQALNPAKFRELITLEMAEGANLQLQSHYHVAGSMEEHLGVVRTAFLAWRRQEDQNDYRYSYVLGITDDTVIFYASDWVTDSYDYYTIGYTKGADGVKFEGTPKQVAASIVISALGVNNDADGSVVDQAKNMKQDAVTTATDPVIDGLVNREGTEPPPAVAKTGTPTDANTTGSNVDLGTTDDTAARTIGNNDLATSDGAPAESGAVKTALDKEEAGLKQKKKKKTEEGADDGDDEDEDPKAPAIAQSTATPTLPLLQSKSIDKMRQMSLGGVTSYRLEQAADGKKLMRLSAIVTRGDIINSQNQVYPTKLWEAQMTQMNAAAQAGKFIGRVEHQSEKGLQDTALKFDKFWMQGNDVCADITVVETQSGLDLKAQIEAGVCVDFSTVGYGSVTQGKFNGQPVDIIQDDFVCHRIDAVWFASSEGSTTTDVRYQSNNAPTETAMNTATTQQQAAEEEVKALAAQQTLQQAREQLLAQAKGKLATPGYNSLVTRLAKETESLGLMQAYKATMPLLEDMFPAEAAETLTQSTVAYAPTFWAAKSKEELAPQTPRDWIERAIADMPDTWEHNQSALAPLPKDVASHIKSPKAAMRKVMQNMVKSSMPQVGWYGESAMNALLALEQGKLDRATDILDRTLQQSLATGATIAGTNGDPGGAPLSTPLIFPLVRRVYPMYIMNMIASIQPMDRPDGKIFFLDTWRVVTGTNDANALPSSSITTTNDPRQDVNTTANPFSPTFASNNTEGSTPSMLRMSLKSIAVRANNKKLEAQWSLEEAMDLQAYHGLDASQELMGALAREMAIEWNMIVLNDMLATASASNRTFGQVAPTGFTQKEWDDYFWNYIQAVDNDVFQKRNGQCTHMVMGVNAALAAGKSLKFMADINGPDAGDIERFPGMTTFPVMRTPSGNALRIIKTNLWTGTNANKVLMIRRGSDWSDTPYIFAPYADFVTPQFTNPGDFTQQQGIMSRAANQVVVSEAMGILTINSGATGVVV